MIGVGNLQRNESRQTGGVPIRQRSPESPIIDSARLLADRKEVRINHGGRVYRLRVTRNGKLILNK